jgi:thymidylate synthase
LPPYVRFANFKARKLKLEYIKREFRWYLKGDRYDTSITEHASMWKGLVNADGGINSNYGQYINKQFDKVIETLKADKDSRRAGIMILSSEHLLSDTKDVPCTYAMNFRIRDNKLNMTVHMRSQDAIFGMGNDAPAFSFVQEMVYVTLRDTYPELVMGNYHHFADSLHIYERHFEMVEEILEHPIEFDSIDCPRISSSAEVEYLRSNQIENDLDMTDINPIPDEFNFVKWLVSKENDNS